jgi:glycerate-2-kinase
MNESFIKNFDELATTQNRKMALEIMEAGYSAINTEKVMASSIHLAGNILSIKEKEFDLSKFKNIKVVGFGKSSCEAALALEMILGNKITGGVVIGLERIDMKYIETFAGTHPRPSEANIEAGRKIYELIKKSTEEDLIIVLASGGGSALLCYPENEYVQGAKLYDRFLKSGKTISEMNIIRKHLSLLKGGGLAKVAYPATVIGLIFSDVPGSDFASVASGCTYKDTTTMEDVKKIIGENNLGDFDLIETPKEDKYFEKVFNFVVVSNEIAINKMAEKAKEFDLETKIVSTELYDETNIALNKIFLAKKENAVILAAGEPKIRVEGEKIGKGGRNLHMSLQTIKNEMLDENSVFISFASDGMDNSDVAGAIVDKNTIEKVKELDLKVDDYLERFDSYNFFQKTGDMIFTGPIGANVSDLMLLLTKK